MAAALVAQHLHSLGKHRVLTVHHKEGQHRTQLFHGIGPGGACLLLPGHEDLGVFGHAEARLFRQVNGSFAHHLGVQPAAGLKEELGQRPCLVLGHQIDALFFRLCQNGGFHASFHDDALFGSADGAVVKGLGADYIRHRFRHVRGGVDEGRPISRPHANGGLAGGVGSAHHPRSAGGQQELYFRCGHHLLGARHFVFGQASDGSLRGPCRFCRPGKDLRCRAAAFCRFGMGRKHNGAAGLYRDEGLVANRGRGVGAGNNSSDDPHGNPDFPQTFLPVFPQNSHGFHGFNGTQNILAGKAILLRFVLSIAKARFFHRHFGKGSAFVLKSSGHGPHNGIQLFLRQGFQGLLRLTCPAAQHPCFLTGQQIFIKFCHGVLLSLSTAGWIHPRPWPSDGRFPQSPSFPASAGTPGWRSFR